MRTLVFQCARLFQHLRSLPTSLNCFFAFFSAQLHHYVRARYFLPRLLPAPLFVCSAGVRRVFVFLPLRSHIGNIVSRCHCLGTRSNNGHREPEGNQPGEGQLTVLGFTSSRSVGALVNRDFEPLFTNWLRWSDVFKKKKNVKKLCKQEC